MVTRESVVLYKSIQKRSQKFTRLNAIAENTNSNGFRSFMLSQYSTKNQSLVADGLPPNDLSQIPKTYTEGMVDGQVGKDPADPESWDYYSGWAIGHRMYECQKRGIELPDDF